MELLETIQFALLRLASALCVPLALFTVITTARRPDIYERYAWGIFSLGLLTLTWLLNAYLNQNTRTHNFFQSKKKTIMDAAFELWNDAKPFIPSWFDNLPTSKNLNSNSQNDICFDDQTTGISSFENSNTSELPPNPHISNVIPTYFQ